MQWGKQKNIAHLKIIRKQIGVESELMDNPWNLYTRLCEMQHRSCLELQVEVSIQML